MANILGQMGSSQFGRRPVVVIQNNIGNKFSPTIIVTTVTSNLKKKDLPTHVPIKGGGLSVESVVQCEQIHTISKEQLICRLGCVDPCKMQEINHAISVSLSEVA